MSDELQYIQDELEEKLMKFCAPIYISPSVNAPPSKIIANGTCSFIDTGELLLLVTCFHVWEGYLEEKAKNKDAILAVVLGTGFNAVAFHPTLIDGDKDIDLAVFHWKSDYFGEKQFFPIRNFPIPTVEIGNVIAIQGFPGAGRTGTDTGGKFGACFLGCAVTAVNERRILIANDPGQLRSVQTGKAVSPLEVGGMSGSPAYTYRDGWILGGFLLAGSTTDGSLYLSHASFLQADGKLDRSRLKRAATVSETVS